MNWHSVPTALSLLLSRASLVLAWWAVLVARSSLKQAKLVAERDQRDWRQRKWFDLYFEVNEACDLLDRFLTQYGGLSPRSMTPAQTVEWNDVMHRVRRTHAMALVFPKNPAIDALLKSTVFNDPADAVSKQALQKMLDAMECLRQKALVDAGVLDWSSTLNY